MFNYYFVVFDWPSTPLFISQDTTRGYCMSRKAPADIVQVRLQATKEENGFKRPFDISDRRVWYNYLRIPESDWLEKWSFSFTPLKFMSCEIKELRLGPNIALRREAVEEDCVNLKLKAPCREIFAHSTALYPNDLYLLQYRCEDLKLANPLFPHRCVF